MVRIARKDTYGIEDLGAGVKVRRRIVAGTAIPAHYEVEGEAEDTTPARGIRRTPAAAPPPPAPEPEAAAPEGPADTPAAAPERPTPPAPRPAPPAPRPRGGRRGAR